MNEELLKLLMGTKGGGDALLSLLMGSGDGDNTNFALPTGQGTPEKKPDPVGTTPAPTIPQVPQTTPLTDVQGNPPQDEQSIWSKLFTPDFKLANLLGTLGGGLGNPLGGAVAQFSQQKLYAEALKNLLGEQNGKKG
jgi:hypothetical protein